MPTSDGKIRGISVPSVPWHENEKPPLFHSGTKLPPRAGELPESAFYTIGNILAQTAKHARKTGRSRRPVDDAAM